MAFFSAHFLEIIKPQMMRSLIISEKCVATPIFFLDSNSANAKFCFLCIVLNHAKISLS